MRRGFTTGACAQAATRAAALMLAQGSIPREAPAPGGDPGVAPGRPRIGRGDPGPSGIDSDRSSGDSGLNGNDSGRSPGDPGKTGDDTGERGRLHPEAVKANPGSLGGDAAANANPGPSAGSVRIVLPGGEPAVFAVEVHGNGICSVVKDAGDDPDITDGIRVFASVTARSDKRIRVDGGEGVGRVMQAGLAVEPGRAAINPVPLEFLRTEAGAALPGGADVVISIPGGERLAARTFNPRLGIEGGLSILGTTGRVEPWSSAAYQESLIPQLDVAIAAGVREPVLVPGAKGERAALRAGYPPAALIQTGNFIGMMLGAARKRGVREAVLLGHASKLAKLARGDFNTHSRRSRAPLDVLAAAAQARGWSAERAAALATLPTTEAAVRELLAAGGGAVLDEAARRAAAAAAKEFDLKIEVMLTDGRGEIVGRSG